MDIYMCVYTCMYIWRIRWIVEALLIFEMLVRYWKWLTGTNITSYNKLLPWKTSSLGKLLLDLAATIPRRYHEILKWIPNGTDDGCILYDSARVFVYYVTVKSCKTTLYPISCSHYSVRRFKIIYTSEY